MTVAIQKASETLVDRARQGDQNAIGMMIEITKNREAGNPQADLAWKYSYAYAKKKPPPAQMSFGHEGRCSSFGGLRKANKGKGRTYGRLVVKFVLNMGKNIEDSKIAAHVLAQGHAIDWLAIRSVLSATPSELRPSFRIGYQTPSVIPATEASPAELKIMQLGYIMGLAEKIHKLKMPDTPISNFSPRMGWEVGEPEDLEING